MPRLTAIAGAAVLLAAGCGGSSPRDVVPPSTDVRTQPGAPAVRDAYDYVAKRPHGTIALADSRNIAKADADAAVDALADRFEACAAGLDAEGTLVEGAVRIAAEQEAAWPAPVLSVRIAPGDAVAQNALLCVIAPLRAGRLPPSPAAARAGLAIEAVWQPAGKRAPREPR